MSSQTPPQNPPQSPFYTPAAGQQQPRAHRLPVAAIIGGAVLILLVVAGIGVALGVVGGGGAEPTPSLPALGEAPAAETPAAETPTPVETGAPTAALPGETPAPTPTTESPEAATPSPEAATPSPEAATPSPAAVTPSPEPGTVSRPGGGEAAAGSQNIEVENIVATVPADWQVLQQEPDAIMVTDPETGGLLILESRVAEEPWTLDELQATIVATWEELAPDTQICAEPTDAPVPGGPAEGRLFALCYTAAPMGGEAGPVIDAYHFGLEANGTQIFLINAFARAETFDAFVEKFGEVFVTWLLLPG